MLTAIFPNFGMCKLNSVQPIKLRIQGKDWLLQNIFQYGQGCAVKPLLKDNLNKGYNTITKPLHKKQILWSLQYHGNTILSLN